MKIADLDIMKIKNLKRHYFLDEAARYKGLPGYY